LKRASAFLRLFFLLVGIFSFYTVSFSAAQSGSNSGDDRITGISISGLKRTRLSTAERPLHKFIGLRADEVEADEVRAAILTTGVLEPLSVEIKGQVLSVTVREKWAIFPIPVVMASTEGIMAGGAFFDANAFGLSDKFFVAGMYRSDGWSISSGYIHSSPGGRVPGWNVMGSFLQEERHDSDQNNNDLRCFDLDTISFSAGLNIPLLKDSDLLTASTLVSFNEYSLRNTEDAMNGPDDGLSLFGIGEEFSIRKNKWDGYLLSQELASLRYTCRIPLNGSPYHSLRFQGIWEKSLVPGFRLNMRAGLLYGPDAPILAESPPSVAQVAILPRNFSARSYAGVSAGLEKYILKFPIGTLSLSAVYQLVYSYGSVLGDSLDHGILGMVTFYLNRLAIPALGAGVAYNVEKNYLQASFTLGMSF